MTKWELIQAKLRRLTEALCRKQQRREEPKPPTGYRLCKTQPTYSAVDKNGHILLWIPSGYDMEEKFWIEGFWKGTSFNEKLTPAQVSRFSKWLLEEDDS